MEGDIKPAQHIGNLRNRTGTAVGKPLTRHGCAASHSIEAIVIDGGFRLEIQQDNRNLGSQNYREEDRGECIGRDVYNEEIDILLPARTSRFHRLRMTVDQPQVDDGSILRLYLLLDRAEIAAKALLKTIKLRPVGMQAKTCETYPKIHSCSNHSNS